MDPLYALQSASDYPGPIGGIGVAVMLVGCVAVACAALLEHVTGRSNFVTRALDRWTHGT